ncbi:hypothetical protein [Pseudomonas sp. P9_31]|uniref:DUF7079 family protein n=1 Tax=Pseudomonas sp. P9_31 TaxID=3043448 RepID=UPI002A36EA9D|nr:hypothetical protein [Pseudomonas sp. P9_31]WPN56321.1 hypothetical protein QMK51_19495 [Pseudomonas sp. P9_31]
MEHPISRQERADIRWALSDAFVDNEVNYAAIAKQVKDFDKKDIEDILFSEVAPVCHTNLESILPSIWSCFNREELESDIEKMLRLRQQSFFRRQLDKLLIEWLRYRYKYIWIEIAKHYQNKK